LSGSFTGVRKILAIKLRHIGDVLLTVPALKAIRETFPEAELAILVNAGTEQMLTLNPVIDRIHSYDREKAGHGLTARIREEVRLFKEVRSQGYDLTINLTEGDRGALLSFFSGARYRLGLRTRRKNDWLMGHLYSHLADPPDGRLHMVERDLGLLQALGISGGDGKVDIFFSSDDEMRAVKILSEDGIDTDTPFIHIHPTSRWMFKAWTVEENARVADHFEQRGIRVVMTSGPDGREKDMLREIADQCSTRPLFLPGRLTLKELAAITDRASLFFGVDSAPMHMASALETPVVVLFGPSKEFNWGPRGTGDEVITTDHDCRPCGQDGCNGTKISECLTQIPAARVIQAIEGRLSN